MLRRAGHADAGQERDASAGGLPGQHAGLVRSQRRVTALPRRLADGAGIPGPR